MKGKWHGRSLTIALFLGALTRSSPIARAQANSWISPNFGKWETNSNWSLNAAPTNGHSVFITNFFSKTVTIDVITSGGSPGTMTISNLTVSAATGSANTLFLNNSGFGTPLRVLNSLSISANGTLLVFSNSTVRVDRVTPTGSLTVDGGGFANLFAGGTVIATNGLTVIGNTGVGNMTINGTLRAANLNVGGLAGSVGTLRLESGLAEMRADWSVALAAGSMGTVLMTGGQLNGNAFNSIGAGGSGQMTVSNGTMLARALFVGKATGAAGTMTIAGGTVNAGTSTFVTSRLTVGDDLNSTGTMWITSGQLNVTNPPLGGGPSVILGRSGIGRLTLSNGTMNADTLVVAMNAGSTSLLAVAGGTLTAARLVVTNNNVLITWPIAPTSGNGSFLSYTVQFGTNLATGVTNNLAFIPIGPGTPPATTNYLDVGGATNLPARFYRVLGFID